MKPRNGAVIALLLLATCNEENQATVSPTVESAREALGKLPASEAATWQKVGASTLPNGRYLQAAAFDETRKVVVMFGGEGSMEMVRIATALNRSGLETQLILLCGKHRAAARALRAIDAHMPMHIEGFTRDVPFFMSLGDYFIGKPGPGSISEALAMRLPVVVESNAWTLAHERYNAEWILERGVGVVVNNFSKVADAVGELLHPDRLAQFRARAAAVRNSAVFEVPQILAEIFSRHDRGAGEPYYGEPAQARAAHRIERVSPARISHV